MNSLRSLVFIILALCAVLTFTACGGEQKSNDDSSAQSNTESANNTDSSVIDDTTTSSDEVLSVDAPSSEAEDGKVTYTVSVVDENGVAIGDAMIQLCKEACIPGRTNADGVAVWTVAEDDYKVSFMSMPAGYTYSGEETEFYFEDGEYELTITLKVAE